MDRQSTGDASLAHALLEPSSIAIVGASDDPTKTAGRPLRFLRASGFAGRVYPVNPRATVQGETAYPDLSALPEVPEHVFVLAATDAVLPIVEQCGRLGVRLVTILASGFAEAGPTGGALERRLIDIARRSGMRILGPSSLGVVNTANGMRLTANAAFVETELPAGRLFIASQSGSMIGSLVSRGKARGVAFAALVSVGGEADLSVGEICAATIDRDDIDGYVLFLESLRHGAALRAFAAEAARRGKPVVAYKIGRCAAAAEMAVTHTGALAGEDDVADAFFKGLGIARVDVYESLLEAPALARRIPLSAKPSAMRRVGVVTTTGGGAAMVVDQLGIRGVTVESISAATIERLNAAGIAFSGGRVLDLTLAGTKYAIMKSALEIMLAASEFDLVLVVVGSSARFQPDLAVQPILDCATDATPVAVMLVPDAPEALAALTRAGVPCFRSPEACGDSIAAVFGRRVPVASHPIEHGPSAPTALDEARAYGVLDRLGIARPDFVVASLSEPAPTLPFAYPVVAKVCSDRIPHKTDVGGVVLSIADPQGLEIAFATLRRNLSERAPDAHCDEVVVMPMHEGLGEVLAGYRVDPEVGPIVVLAAGGVWAEVLRDRSIRLAPVTTEVAWEMIDEVRMLRALSGLRGKERGDLQALAEAIAALSRLAVEPAMRVAEAEINPLLVLPHRRGVVALDALVLVHDSQE